MSKYFKCNAIENPILWYVSYYRYKSIETLKKRWKTILFVLFWSFFFKICRENEFMTIFVILTTIMLIFYNLDFSEKKSNISAYSVFNKNFEKIAGTFTPDDLLNEMNIRKFEVKNEVNTTNFVELTKIEPKYIKDPHSKCDCGSNKKFKNCCFKK
jgi:hypothetical protein